jgi:hypothetical protein
MPITRTPIIDDDGSGTTGTIINDAWKTEFYNQIDAAIAPILGSWTPIDASGASLVFSGTTAGSYARTDNVIHLWGQVQFPATSNGVGALIGGLPFANAGQHAGFFATFGAARLFHCPAGNAICYPLNAATGVAFTNADLSGVLLIFQGSYRMA